MAMPWINDTTGQNDRLSADITTVIEIYSKAHIGFVHLPKSGGTSVENLLKGIGRVEQTSHCGNFFKGVKMLQANAHNKTLRYVFGSKRSYGLHKFNSGSRPFLYLTWLRDPVDKFVSAYYYVKKTAPYFHSLFKKYVKPAKDLTAFLKMTKNVRIQTFDNHFTRLLLFDDFPNIEASFEDCCGSTSSNVPELTEKHYLVAKRNLESNMAFVGLTEEFKTSQDMVCYMLGLPIRESDVHVNANPHRVNITAWERQEIERRNIWDIKLYEDARLIFEEQREIYLKLKDV
ncbi:heparan-sulfate 6-O-sulfotransferase 3-like [Glandiceps talaboti]